MAEYGQPVGDGMDMEKLDVYNYFIQYFNNPEMQKLKELKVDYSINGASSSQTIPDGQTFALSAPPLTDSKSAKDSGADFMNSLWSAVWLFIKVFYFVSMLILSWNIGKQYNQGAAVVITLLTFITYGLFPIFMMPFVIFFWRIVVNHDVITLT